VNLQPIYPPLREGQRVACCKCGKMGATLADLHGHFGDFYCKECARDLEMQDHLRTTSEYYRKHENEPNVDHD
jgi:hypothetical protein